MQIHFELGLEERKHAELFRVARENGVCRTEQFFQAWQFQSCAMDDLSPSMFYINATRQVFASLQEVYAWYGWAAYERTCTLACTYSTSPLASMLSLAVNLCNSSGEEEMGGAQVFLDRISPIYVQVSLSQENNPARRIVLGSVPITHETEEDVLREEIVRLSGMAKTFSSQAREISEVRIHFSNAQLPFCCSTTRFRNELMVHESFDPNVQQACLEGEELVTICSEACVDACMVQTIIAFVLAPPFPPFPPSSIPVCWFGCANLLLIGFDKIWSKFKLECQAEGRDGFRLVQEQGANELAIRSCEVMTRVIPLAPSSSNSSGRGNNWESLAQQALGRALNQCLTQWQQVRVRAKQQHALQSVAHSLAAILVQSSPLTKHAAMELLQQTEANESLEQLILYRLLNMPRQDGDNAEDSDEDTVIF